MMNPEIRSSALFFLLHNTSILLTLDKTQDSLGPEKDGRTMAAVPKHACVCAQSWRTTSVKTISSKSTLPAQAGSLQVYGPDKIHPRILKELGDVIAKLLSVIFEQSWKSW